jgi:hypothetical protein
MQKRVVFGLLCILFVFNGSGFRGAFAKCPRPITIGESWQITSKRLSETREVRVFLPSSYSNSKRRYPVIYTLDGELTGPVVASAVQFMAGSSPIPQMPEAIVVAIVNNDRNRDMPIPNAYGKKGESNFLAFLTDELIPTVEQKTGHISFEILVGHSQGGINSLSTHWPNGRRRFNGICRWIAPVTGFPEVKPLIEKARRVEITKNPNYRGRVVSIEKPMVGERSGRRSSVVLRKGFTESRSRSRTKRTKRLCIRASTRVSKFCSTITHRR